MRPHRTRSTGFTLIELLVVVAIVGVLAAIAIPSFSGRQGKAYDARLMHDARNAASAQEAYWDDNGEYFGGNCGTLPQLTLSPDVTCTATALSGGQAFRVQTTHPRASRTCSWDTTSTPNLTCS